jgi:hypothetical protein
MRTILFAEESGEHISFFGLTPIGDGQRTLSSPLRFSKGCSCIGRMRTFMYSQGLMVNVKAI